MVKSLVQPYIDIFLKSKRQNQDLYALQNNIIKECAKMENLTEEVIFTRLVEGFKVEIIGTFLTPDLKNSYQNEFSEKIIYDFNNTLEKMKITKPKERAVKKHWQCPAGDVQEIHYLNGNVRNEFAISPRLRRVILDEIQSFITNDEKPSFLRKNEKNYFRNMVNKLTGEPYYLTFDTDQIIEQCRTLVEQIAVLNSEGLLQFIFSSMPEKLKEPQNQLLL